MTQFITLVRREWMQHRIGWLIVMLAPTVLLLLLSLVDGGLRIDINADAVQLPPMRQAPALVQTGLLVLAVTGSTLTLALLSLGFQLPGLARRDQQDRSAEFWCALPVGHAKSVAAMLTTQILLLPWLAIAVGMLGGLLAAGVVVVASLGPVAWLTQPWGQLLASAAALLVRLTVGLLLAAAWLSPVLLLTMAAAAWLRRWGVPVVVALSLAGPLVLDKRLAEPVVGPALNRLSSEALQALLRIDAMPSLQLHSADDLAVLLPRLPGLLLHDLAPLLARAATPAFAGALVGGALGFGLLVLRRRRGA
jgi:hypothetical protein